MRTLTLLSLLTLAACSDDSKDGSDSGAGTTDDSGDTQDTDDTQDSGTTTAYGPDNAWYHAPDASLVPEEAEGARWRKGEMPPNLRFTDQFGDEVWLYQFYGKIVYIDWAAEWCGPCGTFAPYLEAFYQTFGEDAIVLTVMIQNDAAELGDSATVANWTSEHGDAVPTLALNAEDVDRAPGMGSFPNIYLLDPELRLAQTSVNTLYDDTWIEQVMDRMVLPIGGSLDNDAEDCDDGIDNDLDLVADCMDEACWDDPVCAVSAEVTGAISPCTPAIDDADETLDVWQVEVRDVVAFFSTDTLADDSKFDDVVMIKEDSADWSKLEVRGDDQWDCTYKPEDYGCAQGWLRPGTWQVAVKAGTGGSSENDGDCANPDYGAYSMSFRGDVSVELLHDDVIRGDL